MKTVYLYGMRLRGFSPGCQPTNGFIDCREDIMGEYYNVLAYNRMLTRQEMRDYDLDFIGKRQKPEVYSE